MEKKKEGEGKEKNEESEKKNKEIEIRYGPACVLKVGGVRIVVNNKKI